MRVDPDNPLLEDAERRRREAQSPGLAISRPALQPQEFLVVNGQRIPWPPRPIAASHQRLTKLGVSAVLRDALKRQAEAAGRPDPALELSAAAAMKRVPPLLRDALRRAAAAKAGQ